MNTSNKYKIPVFQYLLGIITFLATVGGVFTSLNAQEVEQEIIICVIGLVIIILSGSVLYLYTQKRDILFKRNKLLILFTVYHIVFIAILFVIKVHPYLLPILVASMLVALLLDEQIAFLINGVLTLIAAMLNFENALAIIFFYLITGTVAALIINLSNKRRNILWISLAIIGINAVTTLFLNVLVYNGQPELKYVLYGVSNGCFSVIFTIGSIPLWEGLFRVVTPYKLLELSNSDQKLIQRLLIEAPGTFHHSQLVANLAETATTDIGGNYLLARVGAIYHDIGKLKNPEMFIENQNGTNPHDSMDPTESARVILDHVKYGIQLANEYKLPKKIKDIIVQHQGKTTIKYFYNKAKVANSHSKIDVDNFTYVGPKPKTVEAAVVMLADSVEAAVRSLPQSDKTMDKIEELVAKVIQTKLDEGQLDECDLRLSEFNTISISFLKVYKGLYHDRVAKEIS